MNIFQDFQIGSLLLKAKLTQPTGRTDSMLPVRALAHVSKRYRVSYGDIMHKGENEKWLLARHHSYGRNNVFLALSINSSIRVKSNIRRIDPTTKMPTNGWNTESYLLDAVKEVEDPREIKGLTQSRSVYYVGSPIGLESTIDDAVVSKVIPIAGIYRVEV